MNEHDSTLNFVALALFILELLLLVVYIASQYKMLPYYYMRTATPYAILYVLCLTFRLVMLSLEIGNSINTQFASNAISDAAMTIDKVLEFALLRFIMNAREVHVKLLSDSYQDF